MAISPLFLIPPQVDQNRVISTLGAQAELMPRLKLDFSSDRGVTEEFNLVIDEILNHLKVSLDQLGQSPRY